MSFGSFLNFVYISPLFGLSFIGVLGSFMLSFFGVLLREKDRRMFLTLGLKRENREHWEFLREGRHQGRQYLEEIKNYIKTYLAPLTCGKHLAFVTKRN